MFFTITIQTYNHAEGLAETLGSLAGLRCPEDTDYEILVVDNNSSDRTSAVIREFSSVLGPRLRGLFEPRQGLSHARNLALAEARGDVICFIDDDAVADPDWVAGHAEVYRADEHVVAVAGRIELRWPEGWSRPPWLSRNLESYLSGLDLGPERIVMEYPRYPYGCNMSVRRDVANQIGGFSTRLGRQGHGLRSNEERHFFHKIYKQGGRVIYTPGAVVHHVIPAERLSRRFFLRRAYAQGISDVVFRREQMVNRQSKIANLRAFLGGWKLLAAICLRASVDIVSHRDSATCFLSLARGAYAAGYIVGAAGITLDR